MNNWAAAKASEMIAWHSFTGEKCCEYHVVQSDQGVVEMHAPQGEKIIILDIFRHTLRRKMSTLVNGGMTDPTDTNEQEFILLSWYWQLLNYGK